MLKTEGVEPVDAVGQQFDPNLRGYFSEESAKVEEGKVINQTQRGFGRNVG